MSLFDLVSHVRAAHSSEVLNFTCGINDCPKTFTKTNTWYKHVAKKHLEEYMKGPEVLSSDGSEESDLELQSGIKLLCNRSLLIIYFV